MKLTTVLITLGLMTFLPAASQAGIWEVPYDAPTIQAGIDSASNGDQVWIWPGTYTGPGNKDMSFNGKEILVVGLAGCVIIDLEGSGRAFNFVTGETSSSGLSNVTIENGYIPYVHSSIPSCGGAILIDGASPTINSVIFRNNWAYSTGGAVHTEHAGSPTFSDCIFEGNSTGQIGGAMCVRGESITITDCDFIGNFNTNSNYSPGALNLDSQHATVTGCVFKNNIGAGATGGVRVGGAVYGYTAEISECEFSGNQAGGFGSALMTWGGTTVTKCTFANNTGTSAIYCIELSSTFDKCIIQDNSGIGLECAGQYIGNPVVTDCQSFGNLGGDWVLCYPHMSLAGAFSSGIPIPGEGNISEDAMFCGDINCPNGPYSLDIASPCAARNSLCGEQIGAYGVGCSGPVKTRPTTWGAIKAIYR